MKAVLTLEFAANEAQLAADVLALVAARNGAPIENDTRAESVTGKERETSTSVRSHRMNRKKDITHGDIRDLMGEVIEIDEDVKRAILDEMNRIGTKCVGTIKDEHLADFYDFLQSLRGE